MTEEAKYELKRYKKAIADHNKAIELNPDDATTYNNRGLAKADFRKHKEAIIDYNEAIKLKPDYADAYHNRGNAQYDLEEYKAAIADYTKAIDLFPTKTEKADAYYNRGNAQYDLEEYKAAIADYTKAIKIKQNFAEAYFNRGIAKENFVRHKEAITDYRKAIDMQCKNAKEGCYKPTICYKFVPINKNTIDMLVKNTVYFSDIPSLNDPLECPLLKGSKLFKQAFLEEYQPRILSLVVPSKSNKKDKNGIHEVIKNTLLFSHYADAHKGICIEYKIDKEFLEQGKGKMFYTRAQYSTDTRAESVQHLFAIKDEQWDYESEGRFVAFGKRETYDLNKSTTRITKIIFGLETTKKDKALLWELLQDKEQKEEQQQVEFFEADNTKEHYFDLVFKRVYRQGHKRRTNKRTQTIIHLCLP